MRVHGQRKRLINPTGVSVGVALPAMRGRSHSPPSNDLPEQIKGRMKVISKSPELLVIDGWHPKAFLFGAAYFALIVGSVVIVVFESAEFIFMALFISAISGGLLVRVNFRQRISFDRIAGEVRFVERKLLWTIKRVARLNPDSRIEIETLQRDHGTPITRRLVLVTDGEITPFSKLFHTQSFDDDQAMLADWLAEASANASMQATDRKSHA